jgi:hypothetical protein
MGNGAGYTPAEQQRRERLRLEAAWQAALSQKGRAMTRRVVHRLMPVLSVVALAALSLALPVATSGCSSPGPPNPYLARNCKSNDNPRVSVNRVVTIYARNYVYAGDSPDRDQYLDHAKAVITGAYTVANRIFAQDGINLQIRPLTTFNFNNAVLNTVPSKPYNDFSVVSEMKRIHSGYPLDIGVHWSEWFKESGSYDEWGGETVYPPCRSAVCNWVLMEGDVRAFERGNTTVKNIGGNLAHELGHYFGLPHPPPMNNSPNLMVDAPFNGFHGTVLTTQQRDMMWANINMNFHFLYSVTCDPPVTVAPRSPQSK